MKKHAPLQDSVKGYMSRFGSLGARKRVGILTKITSTSYNNDCHVNLHLCHLFSPLQKMLSPVCQLYYY